MSSYKHALATCRHIIKHSIDNYQNGALNEIGSALTGSNISYKPLPMSSPLSSASLFCSYLRHRMIRFEENPVPMIRKVLGIFHPKHRIWQTQESADPRKHQVMEMIAALSRRKVIYNAKYSFYEHHLGMDLCGKGKWVSPSILSLLERTHGRRVAMEGKIQALKDLHASMAAPFDQMNSSLYPTGSTAIVLGNNSFYSSVHGPKAIIGMQIRIAGPKKGTRRMVWKKEIGRYSTRSSEDLVFERAQTQLPSKIGIFGITVKIIYAYRKHLVNPKTKCLQLTGPETREKRIGSEHHVPFCNSSSLSADPDPDPSITSLDTNTVPLFGFQGQQMKRTDHWAEEEKLCKLFRDSLKNNNLI